MTALLVVIYIAYISLGLPDAIFGSAWPALHLSIGAAVSWAGVYSTVLALCAVISSFFSGKVIARFGTAKVTCVSVFMTVVGLFGISFSSSFWVLCFAAVPLGLGSGCIDAALNSFVALHYAARHMNWLHCSWGIGATAGPAIISLFIAQPNGWCNGYQLIGFVQLVIAIIVLLSLPMWKKAVPEKAAQSAENPQLLSYKNMLSMRGVKAMVLVFFLYCGIEYLCGIWGATYFVEAKGLPAELAAQLAGTFYLGITVGRLAAGFLSIKISEKNIIFSGCALIACAIVCLLLPWQAAYLPALLLLGLGCAPLYPGLMHCVPDLFGKREASSIIGMLMASAVLGAMLIPPLFGALSVSLTTAIFPAMLVCVSAPVLLIIARLFKTKGKQVTKTKMHITEKLKRWFAPQDMSVGKPWKCIAAFALPMLVGNLAQQLYNTADAIIVGRYVGDNALAAVGSAAPILNLLLALFVGIATGAGILVAQNFGAKDRVRLSQTIGNCITLTAIATGFIMVAGVVVTRPLLVLLHTPDSILSWCTDYLTIFFVGIAGFFFYNILSGILRGLGDSLSALGFLLLATVLNVGLDLWFVKGLNMGVAGVALATVLAQGVSAVLCLVKLLHMHDVFDLTRKELKPRKEFMWGIVRIGIPSGITQAIFSLAMIVVQSLTNSFGEMVIASNVIIMRVDGFAVMPSFTFGQAMTTYAGQNVGAGKPHRVLQGTRQGTAMAVGVSVVLTILILLYGKALMGIFTTTQSLIDLSMQLMCILAVGYIAMAITQCLAGVMRGQGDTITPMWISLLTTVILRVPLAYGIAYFTRSAQYPTGRPESTYISLLVSWVLGAIITAIIFSLKQRQQAKAVPALPLL